MMMITDVKYVGLLSNRLDQFSKRDSHLWNFRCPICGDSRRNKLKARGYFYEVKSNIVFKCHNCGVGMSLGNFLKTVANDLYEEYKLEKFRATKGDEAPAAKKQKDITDASPPRFLAKGSPLRQLKKVSQLPAEHPCKRYIVKRQLPTNTHFKLFYCSKFKEWTNGLVPNKFKSIENDEPRLIIPFMSASGKLVGYQGRSFKKDGIRYITIMLDPSHLKVYGLDTVDTNQRVYVLEGPIDSLFVPNSIAMMGSDLDVSRINIDKCTYVYDNEPRNPQICNKIENAIKAGKEVCLWPAHIDQKDVNDMVLAGMSPADIRLTIDANTFSGLAAITIFNKWKKI